MAKPGRKDLIPEALSKLESIGFQINHSVPPGCWSDQVYALSINGLKEFALIQCRSYQSDNRYLVGIIVEALQKVDCVVLFFQGRRKLLKITAPILRDLFGKCRNLGIAAFTGEVEQQWRVNVQLGDEGLIPQGSSWYSIDLSPHVILIEPNRPRR